MGLASGDGVQGDAGVDPADHFLQAAAGGRVDDQRGHQVGAYRRFGGVAVGGIVVAHDQQQADVIGIGRCRAATSSSLRVNS